MDSPRRPSNSRLWPLALAGLMLALLPGAGHAQNAVPIPVTGWNLDMIFEAGTTSRIDAFWDPQSHTTWGEAGVITGKTVNGFPASRTFTSTALRNGTSIRTNTQFQLQPYTGPNVAFLGGSGAVTMTLLTPAKYKTVNVLSASFSDHANFNHIRVTLGFTDRGPVDIIYYTNVLSNPVTFSATSWGEAIWGPGGAISVERVAHSAALTATMSDPITYSQGGFGLVEAVIDLTQAPYDLQNYTLSWIYFYKPAGYTTAGIFGVSGTPVAVPQIAPTITGHPAAIVRCEGQTASFTATASGSPAPAVQWQVSSDGGANFTNVAGANAGTLSFTSALAQSGNRYRAVFTNATATATSDPATLIVNALPAQPVITPQPSSVIVNSTGNQATGSAGAATYAWTISGGAITSAANLQTITYTAGTGATVTLNLTVANASGCTASTSVAVPTYVQPAPPLVTLQPLTQAVCVGSTVTLNAAASGSPTPAVQWQLRTGGVGEFADLPGATSPTLNFTAQLPQSGNQYRARFTNPLGTAESNAATLTVDMPPEPPAIIAAPRSVLSNSPGNQASGPAGAASYAWTITNGMLTSAANLPAITYRAGSTGATTLQLTVGNTTGCTASNSINVPIVVIPPVGGTTAAPIALTGWNNDTIFEVPNPPTAASTVDRFFDLGSTITWAESGTITGKTVNGLPPSRTFISAAFTNSTRTTRTNTEFAFQPYNGPNTAYLGAGGSLTLQLTAPSKYRSLNVLTASSSSQNNGVNLLMTLAFADRAPVQVVLYQTALGVNATFDVPDWGWASSYWKGAITADRVIHSSTFTATASDPITYVQAGFAMGESVIDLTQPSLGLESFTLTSITFTKPPDNATNAAIYAVSGIANSPPPGFNPQIADVAIVSGMATITGERLSVGRGYIVERSFDLSAWESIDVFVADAAAKAWSEPMPAERPVFYRFREY